MRKREQTFGEYIKEKRMTHQPRLTLKKMSEMIGVNLSYLSDIENNRKKAFSGEKIEIFCERLGLSENEKEEMYDLAARDNELVSEDIADIIMYTESGDLARKALRLEKQGKGGVELWKKLIQQMEESK